MAPISPAAFARALGELSDAALADFVADLWAARGWETRVEDGTVVAAAGERTRRLWIRPRDGLPRRLLTRVGGWRAAPAAEQADRTGDAVVVRALEGPDDPGVIDATELRGMALYAVAPATRDRLFERHLGRPPTASPSGRRGWRASVSTPVAASALLLVLAAALGAAAIGSPGPAPAGAPGAGDNGSADAGPEPETVARPSTPEGRDYPAGLGPDGVRNVNSLVVSHVLGLSARSHEWTIEYREVESGHTRGAVRETVWVENASLYRSRVVREGTLRTDPAVVSGITSFSYESEEFQRVNVRYVRIEENGTTRYHRDVLWPWGNPGAEDLPPFTRDPINLIEWYLSVDESWIVDTSERNGTRFYRVAGRAETTAPIAGVRVTATIDEDGIVRRLRYVDRPTDGRPQIEVAFRVGGLGNTTVEPPTWLDEARRATAGQYGTPLDRGDGTATTTATPGGE